MCIWIYALNFIADIVLHNRIFLTIKPLPSGKGKHTMMSMHSWKQVHGASRVFGMLRKATKKNQMSNKDVAKF
jgi:hypothetical protein